MQSPQTEMALRQDALQRLMSGFQAADIPRQLDLSRYQTQLGTWTSGLTNSPFSGGTIQSGRQYPNIGQTALDTGSNAAMMYYLMNARNNNTASAKEAGNTLANYRNQFTQGVVED